MVRTLRSRGSRTVPAVVAALMLAAVGHADRAVKKYEQHSMDRERPPQASAKPVTMEPPSDAIVLFDGEDLSKWTSTEGEEAPFIVKNGYMEVDPDEGSIKTKKKFGDCQLHVEWASPKPAHGEGQHRGNSGVFLGIPGKTACYYEVQILDNYKNETYADGMAGAIYGQYPPLKDVCRPPGKWQSYDIIYRRPRFDDDGNVEKPATLTVFHNGVLVQDNEALIGPTAHEDRPSYTPHGKLPIMLQDHGHPVKFRNVWVRPLDESKR